MSVLAMSMSLSKRREIVKAGEAWFAAVHGLAKSDTTEQLNDNSCQPGSGYSEVLV